MAKESTPMMKQYRRLKKALPEDVILFFRLGDFYEMFFEDAKIAAEILDIALTKRNTVPMCGIPHHASEGYLARLIRAGKKVAICEQVQDPSETKGIVEREVTQVVTPGAVLEENVLNSKRNNFLAGLCQFQNSYGLAMLDISTGDFWMEDTSDKKIVLDALLCYQPAECVVPEEGESIPSYAKQLKHQNGMLLTSREAWTFDPGNAHDLLAQHFKVNSLKGYGCNSPSAALGAAGAVFHYVSKELKRSMHHIQRIQVKNPADYMMLDETTIHNLDLLNARKISGNDASLLKTLDHTRTAMGTRLLREWLLRPLTNLNRIRKRHEVLEAFCNDRVLLNTVCDNLTSVRDIERIVSRLNSGRGNARDLQAIKRSLENLPDIKSLISKTQTDRLMELSHRISSLPELVALINESIVEDPPLTLKEGGMINKGYHSELDQLHQAASQGRQWLADFQSQEQERTGIKTLKVRHNRVFGYYIEISKSNLRLVPDTYTRKQTLVNAERFITPELKDYENKIFGAQDRAMNLEYELFLEVRNKVIAETAILQETAAAIAELDVLANLAERALALNYVRPEIRDDRKLLIRDGRHPVIETLAESERFVPNHTTLDTLENQLIIITGPNMAGKSTYIRQVALIVILAHMGSFVPASSAQIGIVDRVFTRVGASDDLAHGRSTFMVEMQETANILNNATPQSLIVLDEIGRGTSTFDGISIAWAVAEYLHNQENVKAKTLFATHYHELTDLAKILPGVKNYKVLVREQSDRIAFLRKIVEGGADKSYGIHVAQLAGLPPSTINRAREILNNLEEGEFTDAGQPKLARKRIQKKKVAINQLTFFDKFN